MNNNVVTSLSVALFVVCIAIGWSISGREKPLSAYHHAYDDRTMLKELAPLMMPYNRFVDPAGIQIKFGDPKVENHSLDCALLPDKKTLVVEDRYGIVFLDIDSQKILYRNTYDDIDAGKGAMSTYSGIKTLDINGTTHVFWGAAGGRNKKSMVFDVVWKGTVAGFQQIFEFAPIDSVPLALPNEVAVSNEADDNYIYVVLNGNNELQKLRIKDKKLVWKTATGMAPYGIALANNKAYVTNWAGPKPEKNGGETAGVPHEYGDVYINPKTGGTSQGSVSVIDAKSGKPIKQVAVGLHPNSIKASSDGRFVYVANANTDDVSVINTSTDELIASIPVRLNIDSNPFIGSSPNGLALNPDGTRLYVSNGMDNAIAVVSLSNKTSSAGNGNDKVTGYIPTGAYPAGLIADDKRLYICNLEGEGSRVKVGDSSTIHQEIATISIVPVPDKNQLASFTKRVENANLYFRTKLSQLMPRADAKPKPVPDRIGEPSPVKHVLYIIKENKTYDQVLGDMPEGDGRKTLCIYGDSVTPNQHRIARKYLLLDNYYASGKSSAEGHQWTDAAMVSDYVEKNVRAWFRSYPHVQTDALVYNEEGFIWNNALDHGKTVRIYGEACNPEWNPHFEWTDIYNGFKHGHPVEFTNHTTISRVEPILSKTCPCADTHQFADVERADAFIKELKHYESLPGDSLPNLMVMALSDDHTTGSEAGFPKPQDMVADNDLAVGEIVDALSHSRFWGNTAIFITEDDTQSGWDHVSAYRTTGFIISPWSGLHQTVHTNYNQTCMVRTIEQILGLPPMNVIDATALPMFDCFNERADSAGTIYTFVPNKTPIDEINPDAKKLTGKAKKFAEQSAQAHFEKVDVGNDDLLNHILWYAAKGDAPYPQSPDAEKHPDKD